MPTLIYAVRRLRVQEVASGDVEVRVERRTNEGMDQLWERLNPVEARELAEALLARGRSAK